MAYSQATANALNQLIAQGLTPEQAFDQLGIPEDDAGFYTVDEVGTPADNPNFGRIESADNFRVEQPEPQPVPEPVPPATQPVEFSPEPVDPETNPGYGEEDDLQEFDDGERDFDTLDTEPVDPEIDPGYGEEDADVFDFDAREPEPVSDTAGYADVGETPENTESIEEFQERQQAAEATRARLANAQQQATIQQRFNQTTQGDWRVRIRLMPGATYLYQVPGDVGILAPLRESNGVIFPYTPTIQTSYVANYDKYDLVHSNYRGYFYKNSAVNDITVAGTFTAQDTREAEYLLAVIHFFRSVTKMFYGQDEFRGAPPPLVELSGFGQFQFNNHPCAVSNFSFTLPNNVDYVRVNPNNQGLNLNPRRALVSSSPTSTISSVLNRLLNAGLPRGAQGSPQDLGTVNQTVNGTGSTTYVPTKMEIQLTLLPIQTRAQVSQGFSLKNFANGNLLRGGYW